MNSYLPNIYISPTVSKVYLVVYRVAYIEKNPENSAAVRVSQVSMVRKLHDKGHKTKFGKIALLLANGA